MEGRQEVVAALNEHKEPLGLIVTGEAESWLPALEMIIGPQMLAPYQVRSRCELLDVVESGIADAAVLDDDVEWTLDVVQVLRMIRRLDRMLPVVVVTWRTDRRLLEDALHLAAFSVVVKPLALEELLRQIQRMMARLDELLRRDEP